jgi:hypothetical protein
MTPQERKLIDELFDRLASLEDVPRDNDAIDAINEGLDRAPNAVYPLVQTALVQDEALKRANARIRELEEQLGVAPGEPVRQSGFLDSMRDTLRGRSSQGSVPSVRPGQTSSAWGNAGARSQAYDGPPQQQAYAAPPQQELQAGAGGGSFLGTAAATAAGVIGGALLMNSIRGLFGGSQHQHSLGGFDPGLSGSGSGSGAPWGDSGGSGLARDAGVNDIGSGGGGGLGGGSRQAGLLDAPPDNGGYNDGGGSDFDSDNTDFAGGDFDGGGDGGGSDTA